MVKLLYKSKWLWLTHFTMHLMGFSSCDINTARQKKTSYGHAAISQLTTTGLLHFGQVNKSTL